MVTAKYFLFGFSANNTISILIKVRYKVFSVIVTYDLKTQDSINVSFILTNAEK